jgi:hypothetical protein
MRKAPPRQPAANRAGSWPFQRTAPTPARGLFGHRTTSLATPTNRCARAFCAYNAQNVNNELWNSEQLSARDSVGNFAKFVPPTVANGKVYLATFSNRLNVYGLLPRPSLAIRLAGSNVALSWPTNGSAGYRVQTNLNLSPGRWFDATKAVVVTNGAFQITLPISAPRTFYRLIR